MLVGGVDVEMADPRLNEPVLQRLAAASGGAYLRADEAGSVVERLQAPRPVDGPTEMRDLWHNGVVLAVLIGLLAVEWMLRRRCGLAWCDGASAAVAMDSACSLAGWLGAPGPASAEKRVALIVSGASGGEKYARADEAVAAGTCNRARRAHRFGRSPCSATTPTTSRATPPRRSEGRSPP